MADEKLANNLRNGIGVLVDMSEANLLGANLREANLQGANFEAADMRRTDLEGANLDGANLVDANLRGAILRRADLRSAQLERANLEGADFLGAKLEGANFSQTRMSGVTLDYASVDKLTQIILPHKYEILDYIIVRRGGNSPSIPSQESIRQKIVVNSIPLVFTSASILEQIVSYREVVRGNNRISNELREEILSFLDSLYRDLENLLRIIPDPGVSMTNEDSEKAAGWTEKFLTASTLAGQKYLSPEAVGNATVPTSIILGCGTIGALLTGFNPLGFGAGTLVGKLITGEIKSGIAADKVAELGQSDSSPTSHGEEMRNADETHRQ